MGIHLPIITDNVEQEKDVDNISELGSSTDDLLPKNI